MLPRRFLHGLSPAVSHPLPCLILFVALLAGYEGGIVGLARRGLTVERTGVDLWLHAGLAELGLPHASLPSLGLLLVAIAWGVFAWKRPAPELPGTLLAMIVESVAAAMGLWALFYLQQPMLKACGLAVGGVTLLPSSLGYVGAGLFEETIFRLVLLGMLCVLLRSAFGWMWGTGLALVTSALLFAAAHHWGSHGDGWHQALFFFRALAGLYLGMIFLVRGFGVAVGTHVVYDLLVGFATR